MALKHVATTVLCLLSLALGATACAGGGDDDSATGDDEVNRAKKASGYDLEGPKALPSNRAPVEFCTEVLSPEQAACERVHGQVKRANSCKDLCSKPIAPQGMAAGYDLTGYKKLPNDRVPVEFCTQALSEEQGACERVQGEISGANGCKHLCSKPIAPRGKAAGYDLRGFKILPNDRVPVEFCAAVVSEVQAACDRAGGTIQGVNGCGHLCSLPL
jgi:hypothetical protein